MKKNVFHYCAVLVLLVMQSACNQTFNQAKPAEPDVVSELVATKKTTAPTVWQDAYGEQQETTENKMGELPAADEKVTQQLTTTFDLWQRIRQGYAIPHDVVHPDTQKQIDWYARHPKYIDRVAERAKKYLHYIVEQVEQRNMPMEIALLPVVESAFKPFAYSPSHASGLWQFIPSTGKIYGLKQNWWYDGRRDVIESTRAALDYLQKLHDDFGDWQLALAAYNCGEGAVARAIKRNQKAGKPTDFWSLSLPRETSAYVPKLMAISKMIAEPTQYQLALPAIANEPYFVVAELKRQIQLNVAAELAGLEQQQFAELNPAFNQWATDPDGPHHLIIPVESLNNFLVGLSELPEDKHVQWARHKIKAGESLGLIAKKYKTHTSVIKKANDLTSSRIRAGRYLMIPVSTGIDVANLALPNQSKATSRKIAKKGKKRSHLVKKGDTWWDLARLYQVDVKTLAGWNNRSLKSMLKPGQKLSLWLTDTSSGNKGNKRSVNYEIKSGDSLWTISRKFNVTVALLRQWNSLSKHMPLQPGQNLTLYIDNESEAGTI